MGEHLVGDNVFKSDKYDWCPEGFFAMKIADPDAWNALLTYARAIKDKDPELSDDLKTAVNQIKHYGVPVDLQEGIWADFEPTEDGTSVEGWFLAQFRDGNILKWSVDRYDSAGDADKAYEAGEVEWERDKAH